MCLQWIEIFLGEDPEVHVSCTNSFSWACLNSYWRYFHCLPQRESDPSQIKTGMQIPLESQDRHVSQTPTL